MGATPPDEWAHDRRHRLERWAKGDVYQWTRAARDVFLPGVPVAAILGFFANGGFDENTTGWISCSDRERAEALEKGKKPLGGDPRKGYGHVGSDDLHELGAGGVEGGYCPEAVAVADDCPWVMLARSERVRGVLGRPGVEGKDWYGAHQDQAVLGVANLARHGRLVREKLDPRIQWALDGDGGKQPKAWTLWPFFCAVSSWSAGPGGIDKHTTRHVEALAPLPESQRVGAFLRLAAAVDDEGNRHKQDEYTGVRWAQKREAMVRAAEFTGEGDAALAWLDDGLGADRASVYAALVKASR